MVSRLEDIVWGGSGIEKVVFDFIRERIPTGATVIELGAGLVSTPALSLFYDLHSVEHDEKYLFHFDKAKYIYAPLVNGWYDRGILEKTLPLKYELVLVDGKNRELILNNMDLFNHEALYVVHDTYREPEQKTAMGLSKILKREVEFYIDGDYWASI